MSPETISYVGESLEPTDTVAAWLDRPGVQRDLVQRFLSDGVFTQQTVNRYVTKGVLNREGRQFVERVLLGTVIPDAAIIETAPPALLQKVSKVVGPVSQAAAVGPEWDVRGLISRALELGRVAEVQGLTVDDLASQYDLMGAEVEPEAVAFLALMQREGAAALRQRFARYAAAARRAQPAAQGQVEMEALAGAPPTPAEALTEAFGIQLLPEDAGGMEPLYDVPALRLTSEPEGPEQGALFGERAGTAAARSLAQTEAAARAKIAQLKEQMAVARRGLELNAERLSPKMREGIEARIRGFASQIAALEKLVNRGQSISAEELRTQVVAGGQEQSPLRRWLNAAREGGAEQGDMFGESLPEALGDVLPEARTTRPPDPIADVGKPAAELDEAALEAQRIADRLAGELQVPPEAEGKRPVSAPEIIEALAKATEAAGKLLRIRTSGRGVGSQAHGAFFPGPDVIRVRMANNIPTASHEVGHAIEKLVYGWPKGGPWKQPLASREMQKELLALGKALYGSRKPAGGYKREGWAEFVRIWVTRTDLNGNATEPATHAPLLTQWFEDAFSKEFPDVRTAIDKAKELTDRYRGQGARKRAEAGMIDPTSLRSRLTRAGRGAREFFSAENWIDMAFPLAELSKAAERELGHPLKPTEDPYVTISALRTTHDARVRYMVENGMIDVAGNVVGAPLADVQPLIKGRYQDFLIYLWAKRTVALQTDPKGPRASGLSAEDARQILVELETPAFMLASSKVYAWNEGVLGYAAQASPTFQAVVDAVRKRDPGNYVPLQREFEELESAWKGSRGATTRSPVQRLKGSGRRVKDPLQAMIAKASTIVAQAHKRMVLDQIIRLARVPGIGEQIVEVPKDQRPAYATTVGDLIERLEREVGAIDIPGLQKLSPLQQADVLGQMLTFFAPVQVPTGQEAGNPIIPIYANGEVRWFEVPKPLYEALASIDIYRMPKVADLILGVPTRLFRAGTTGLRASFGLITNPLRDVQTFYLNTQSNKAAPRLFFEWLRSLGEVALWRTSGKRTEWVDAFMRLGLEMSQPLGQDVLYTRRAARRLAEGRVVRTLDPRNWYDWFRDLVQTPEAAPRIEELRLKAAEVGWQPGQPMTLDQALVLMNAASQVTTDFKAAGRIARIVNQSVPFHNAAIQGPRAHVRAFLRKPSKFLARGLQMTAAALLLWWMVKDEEWYQEMTSKERYLYWHIPFEHPVTGEPELLRIPRAFEAGGIFAAMPEFLADAAYRNDPKLMTEWFQAFVETARVPLIDIVTIDGVPVPVWENPLALTAAEQLANREFYFDRPIVPRGEEARAPEEQFNEYTSRVAIVMGDLFKTSPRRIDHAMQGIFGPVSRDLVEVVGLDPAEVKRERELADLPIVGRLFQRGGALGTRPKSVNELYEVLETATQRQRSTRQPETPRERQLRLQLTDAQRAVTALLFVRQYTPESSQRRRLTAEAADIAQSAVSAYQAGELRRGRFAAQRRRAEAQEERVNPFKRRQATSPAGAPRPPQGPRPPRPR